MSSVRYPAVAGAFYPADRFQLAELVAKLAVGEQEALPAVGAIVPHAGYVYSGACAGRTLAAIDLPASIILIGPNHTGHGSALAAAVEESWATPLGRVDIDRELLEGLVDRCDDLVFDAVAHRSEHSLEVQLPLLQTLAPDARIAPVVVGASDLARLVALGEALADLVLGRDERPLICVSSDMTHYEPADLARQKDEKAIAHLKTVDAKGLLRTVATEDISMCGVGPATAALVAFSRLGVRSGETICYTHSGMVTGDESEVVAYAGMVFRA